jgi:hypothetical protein
MSWNTGSYSRAAILLRCLQKAAPVAFISLLLVPAIFAGNAAASGPPANSSNQAGRAEADFLFEKPEGFIGFRFGRFFPEADSDLFDFVTGELTLEKRDFRAWDFGVDGGVDLHERVDLIFSFDYSKRTKNSEFREWEDESGLPITQTTVYTQIPLTVGIKFLPIPRGRPIGRFSWLPSRIVPFIGGGGGALWYRFTQAGDFVDKDTWEIFPAELQSDGWTPTVYVGSGVDIHIGKAVFVTLDFRYLFAKTDLSRDFVRFDPIDLAGLRATAGLHWHF